MTDKYKNKYRMDTIRLKSWNYGWNAAYYVTINCKNRIQFFGHIKNRLMIRSEIGEIAETCWKAIPEHFPFVKLGAHIIMPDHVHGIIIIDKKVHLETQDIASPFLKTQDITSPLLKTQDIASLRGPKNKFGPQSKNLASIVRGFKVGVTKNARLINTDFSWQPRYYDRIIFNDVIYKRVTNYINANPANWRG